MPTNKQFKAVFVKVQTHRKVAIEATKRDMTFDEFINFLLTFIKK